MRRLRRPRAGVLAAGVLLIAAIVGIGGTAGAVHDLSFQLDGDVSASTTTNVGGKTQTVDWDSLFNANGGKKALPAGFTASVFDRDFQTNGDGSFNTSDPTTFTTGSKDTLNISSGWQCTAANNVNSKIDVMNAYAASYVDTNGHQLLYFALERNANTGDANVAFWFLQDDVGCDSNGGTASFTGNHVDGDLLVVSAFTNGGTVSTIDVYRWNGGANGSLGTTPVAHGVDCRTTSAGDTACATTNNSSTGTNGKISTPWLTANKIDGAGHQLRTSEFFEGGIDLTQAGIAGHCFNDFLGDTRSSQSLTATLFDYASGQLGECTSEIVTTPTPTGSTTIPANGQVTTSDSAALNVTGIASFDGTVTFSLCGPLALDSTSTCDSGGVQIGSPVAVTGNGTYASDDATITAAGRYCWRGDFSGDPNFGVPNASDHSANECFVVNPRQPTLSTSAGASPVSLGNPVTDTASLGNTARQPGSGGVGDGTIDPTTAGSPAAGTIAFTLYDDDCATPATGTGGPFPINVTVNGNGTYGPVSFTPDTAGTYHWVATYSGDAPNTLPSLASDSVCGADPNEDVVVSQIPTIISTSPFAYPNDTDTITSQTAGDQLPPNGTVTFRLYQGGGGKTALQNCNSGSDTVGTGGLIYRQVNTNVGGSHSVTTSTNNTTVAVDTNGSYYWLVIYDPGTSSHVGRQSQCLENTALTFTRDPGQ